MMNTVNIGTCTYDCLLKLDLVYMVRYMNDFIHKNKIMMKSPKKDLSKFISVMALILY